MKPLLVGLLFMFEDEKDADIVYVGRIFVDALQYRKGYGKEIMQQIEKVQSAHL
ncbi:MULTISPECIES: GNAT family N-acetyltransferase [Streptococcus]|uniref:GNAT family N-acetyltransferase n=1 Tax=Streptococcus TaxID=1301 RepID=UPI001F35EABC|nr:MULTISPECIES: GNAT family N-acetyltransferase [Streptococcus]